MVRQLGNHPRAARTLPLRRRVFALWASFALVLGIGVAGWSLATPGPVSAATLIATYEGWDGTRIVTPGGTWARTLLFQGSLQAGRAYRAVVTFTEADSSSTTRGAYAFWWDCGPGSWVGIDAGFATSPTTAQQVTVTATAPGTGSFTCGLVASVTAAATFSRIVVQMYAEGSGLGNFIPVPAPVASPSPSPSPSPSGSPGASPELCYVPLPSGYLGPPAPMPCASPSPSLSPGAGTLYTCGASAWPVQDCRVDIGPIYNGDRIHLTWFSVVTHGPSAVIGAGLIFADPVPQNGGSTAVGTGGDGGAYALPDAACPMYQSWPRASGTDVHECYSSAIWTNGRALPDLLALTARVNLYDYSGSNDYSWSVSVRVWIEPAGSASPAPSGSAAPLGDCFYPLPVGVVGPPAPRPCASGEAAGSTSLGECFYAMPQAYFGPPSPRVCGTGELPGTVGGDGGIGWNGWMGQTPGVDCVVTWVPSSVLPRCPPGTPGMYASDNWPLSGYSCSGGKPGFLRPDVVTWRDFPGLTLDVGAYFAWMGEGVGFALGSVGNTVRFVWNVGADFVIPCFDNVVVAFGTFTDTFRSGPFGTVTGTSASVVGALAGGAAVPFQSFHVLGATISLPLVQVADAAGPVRPFLAPLVWLTIALRALWMIGAAVRAPGPTGP